MLSIVLILDFIFHLWGGHKIIVYTIFLLIRNDESYLRNRNRGGILGKEELDFRFRKAEKKYDLMD